MSLEARLALKARLEKVLSEILSDKYDCNITIKFKPEKEELENENSDSREAAEPSTAFGTDSSTDR